MIRPAIALATLGTVLTAVIVGLAAAWLLDLSTLEGLLLGSIVCATDGAAVFSILRGSSITRRAARVLEGESGLNDPVAVVLVIGFIEAIQKPDYGVLDMVWLGVTELADRRGRRPRRRPAARRWRCSASASAPPASTPSPRSRRPGSPSARPTCCTARASSPST